jgi:hypothetical protein
MSSEVHSDETDRLFRLYLCDHDGASAAGVRLVQRSHRSNVGTAFEAGLAELETNIREDQAELSAILKKMHISPSRTERDRTCLRDRERRRTMISVETK